MKQKKLLIFMPSIEMGGVEKNLFIISNFLSLKFKSVKFITSSFNTEKLNKKIEIIRLNFFNKFLKNRFLKILISCVLITKEIFRQKNIIILSFQANIYAILIAKLFGRKIIIRLNSSPAGWAKNKFKIKFLKKVYSMADLIIVNSFEFKKDILKKFKLKSFCIYNPLDKNTILKKGNNSLKINPFKEKKGIKIISVGRLVDQKDHLTLLKAIQKIKNKINIYLLIIGQGKNKHLLSNYIKKNKLNNIVKIIKYKKNPYPYIKLSDVLVLTSKYEGLPNVLLEGIVLKKFIISSDCPTGPREILENEKGGMLFKTGNYHDLAKKILLFSKKRKINKKKIKHAYKSLKKYDMRNNLNLYLKKIIK